MSKQIKDKSAIRNNGRPTKYRAEFIDFAQQYLICCKDVYVENRLEVQLPTIEGFASFIGVSRDTLYEWAKKHAGFSDTLESIKQLQHQRLVNSGLSGAYNSTIAKLMLCFNHGYSEKKEPLNDKITTIEQLLDAIENEKGEDKERK